MAQKAQKTLAAKNKTTLNRTHLITLGVHTFFLLLRFLVFRRSASNTSSLLKYTLCSAPALIIEAWFESISRPTYTDNNDVKRAGEDLEAKGLTEWMWDIVYWTWGCVAFAAVAGDRAWWAYAVVPLYSVYLAVTTYTGVRKGMGGIFGGGQTTEGGGSAGGIGSGQSKRQAKMEKKGGQRVQYR